MISRAVKFLLIFILITGWVFSGWPQIFNFPPKIQEARAAWGVPKIGTIVTVAAGVGNITLTEPTGVAQGDLMIATIAAKSNYAFTLPAGWTLVATQRSSGDVDSTAGVASGVMAYIVRGASAPDLTFTRSTSADVGHGRITAYSGSFSTPYDTGSSATTLTSTTPTTASITTAGAGELLVAMVACGDNYLTSAFDAATDPTTASGATNTTTAPTNGTWLERSDAGTNTGADTALATADAIRAGAGSTGTLQATVATAAGHVLIVGAFKLAVVPTVSTQDASSVEATTATGNGTIVATGGATARRGFAYMVGTSGDPTTADSVAYEDGFFSTGAYTKGLTGLTPGTNYRVRAYVVNSAETGYGTTVQILTKPAAPTGVSATDGTYIDKVTITWTKSTGATDYHVWRDSTDLGAAGDVATYDDMGAGAPTITPGSASASDGTNNAYVELSLSGASASNGTSHTYKVIASNATGNSADSATDTGYRGVGTLTYQWQRSATDSDASYSDISGATTASYNDTGAPADGSGRYYKCVLNATGATQQTSSADRGYRSVAVVSITLDQETFTYGSVAANTASSTLTLWGGTGITATNGDVLANFDIYGANTTGSGSGWTLAGNTTGDNYMHQFCNDTDNDCATPPASYTALTTSPVLLKSNVAIGGTVRFQLRITTPTTPTDLSQQNAVVTVQASAL